MSGESLTPESRTAAIEKAQAEGFTVIQSDPFRLLLDLDTDASREQFARVLPIVERQFEIAETHAWKSKSGNTHVMLTLKQPIPDVTTRLLLQAALGSDGVKEVLALFRMRSGVAEPSLLFMPQA